MAFSSFPAIYLDHSNLQQFQLQQQQQQQLGHQHGSGVESSQILRHQSPQTAVAVVDGLTPPPPGGGSSIRPGSMVDRARLAKLPVPEAGLKCPRCDSSNTKFCYFNNYNLAQPRHFCKTCRRYWTRGGALRNVPVGGGCRRNKKTKNSSSKQAVNSVNSSACGNTAPCPSISTTDMGMNLSSGFPNLPLMSAIQNLNHYSSGPIGSNLGRYPANMGLAGGVDPWRLPPIGGYEQLSNNFFHFQGEGITETATPVIGDQNLDSPADVKPEEIQAVNLRKQFQINPDHNGQFWSGNPWTGFPGHTSSSSTGHLL